MKAYKLVFVLIFVFIPAHTVAQSIIYKNESGQRIIVTLMQTGVILNIRGQSVHLPINTMNTDPNFFFYTNHGGGVSISKDFQSLMLITFNPPTRTDFKFVEIIDAKDTYYPKQNYVPQNLPKSSTRNISQIQADIQKTKRRIIEMEETLNGLQERNESMTLWPPYQRMIQEERNRLSQLEKELYGSGGY